MDGTSPGHRRGRRAPKHSLPLSTPVSASIAMDGGQTCRLLFRKGDAKLTAVCGATRQHLPIPILEGDGGREFTGQILVDDFDFDGYQDLMIPTATGYGGVNWFYDFHHYNPVTRTFIPIDSPRVPQPVSPQPLNP